MSQFLKLLYALLLILSSHYSLALPLTINANELPTVIHQGTSITTNYLVTNNTSRELSGLFVKYLPPHVQQVISNGSGYCDATFTLQPHGDVLDHCLLTLEISGDVNANDPDPRKHLFVCLTDKTTCVGTLQPLNVTEIASSLLSILITPVTASVDIEGSLQYQAMGTFADQTTQDITRSVHWNSQNTAVATINNGGSARGVATGNSVITALYNDITSNTAHLQVKTFLYVANYNSNQLTSCAINSDGSLGSCHTSANVVVAPIGLNLNPARTYVYATNNNPDVISYCPIQPDGRLGSCATTGINLDDPVGIAFNAKGTRAYIGNWDYDFISICPVQSDASLGICNTSATIFSEPTGIVVHPDDTFIYVSNYISNAVTRCEIVNNTIVNCSDFNNAEFNGLTAIALHPNHTWMYVVSGVGNKISVCDLSTTGMLGNCRSAAEHFNYPAGIAFQPGGHYAYISNYAGNEIVHCTVAESGALENCLVNVGFSGPTGVGVS